MVELFKYNIETYRTVFMKDQTIISDDKVKSPNYSHKDGEWDMNMVNYEYGKKKKLKYNVDYESNLHDDYVKNYGNPLCFIRKDYITLVVESNEDKVSLKIFEGVRLRSAGKSYFMIDKSMEYLTVNKKSGDEYNGSLKHYNKKKEFQEKIC